MEDNEKHEVRLHIESLTNFLKKQKEAETKQLGELSKGQTIGDPLTAKMNQTADNLGSDGDNAPTVSVTAGVARGGGGFETGQPKAQFHDKTKLAEQFEISEEQLRALIGNILSEQMDKLEEGETVVEAVDELLGEPLETDEVELDEAGRCHAAGRGTNLKQQNYPKNLQR